MQLNTQVPMTEFGVKSDAMAPAFDSNHKFMDHVSPKSDLYHFRANLLRPFMNWLYAPYGDSAMLVGPTGSGKSSLVEQVTARLNWPCITVSAHSRMEMPELTGYNMPYTDPVSGDLQTRFVDGPLTRAMREGFVFVLDEYDTLDPAVSVGLHAVQEGRPLVIAEHGGELVKPHPNFRFVVCGNTAGQGDESSLHSGTMQQNLATLDRFRVFEISYIEEAEELKLLMASTPDLDKGVAEKMVKIANSIRARHLGTSAAYLSVTMSTRTLLRWARISCGYVQVGATDATQTALQESLLNRCDKVQRLAIEQIAKSLLGGVWSKAA
jgi:cobaltochelatase CobS